MLETSAPPNTRRAVAVMLTLIATLCILYAVVYFGKGGKCWLWPNKNFRIEGGVNSRCLLVETEAEAKIFADMYGIGKGRGFSTVWDREEILTYLTDFSYHEENGVYVLSAKASWSIRPYRGYPGRILWLKTNPNDIFRGYDDFLSTSHPGMKYEWCPEIKEEYTKLLAPYKSEQ